MPDGSFFIRAQMLDPAIGTVWDPEPHVTHNIHKPECYQSVLDLQHTAAPRNRSQKHASSYTFRRQKANEEQSKIIVTKGCR